MVLLHWRTKHINHSCKPNSVHRKNCLTALVQVWQPFILLWYYYHTPAVYPKAAKSEQLFPGNCLPGWPSYLTLLQVWFALPPVLLTGRWALTSPFHPYPDKSGRYIFCGTFRCPDKSGHPGVTRHPVLWSSDFPPPDKSGSGCPEWFIWFYLFKMDIINLSINYILLITN